MIRQYRGRACDKDDNVNMKTIIFIILITLNLQAMELFQQGMTTRSAAMGGTSIAFVRGPDALFSNPAALSKVEGFSFNLVSVNAAISKNAIDLMSTLQNTGASFTATDLDQLYGKKIFSDISVQGGAVVPYFGVGAYSYNTATQSFSNPSFPFYNVDLVSDYGYIIGGAFELSKNLSFGVSGRHVKRWSGNKDILVTDLLGSGPQDIIEQELQDKGKGNALDVAMLATFDNSWNTSVAVVWRDLGNTRFSTTSGNGPERQEDNLIFGLSSQKAFGLMTVTNAFEYKYIRNDGDITKKLHFGSELALSIIDLRVGYGQGYLSYGAALDFSFLRAEVASYSNELGANAGQSQSDRYQASISLNIDLDQGFKLKTSDGKKMLTWVIFPPDFDPNKKYPTLLYCQGGPQSAVSQFYSFLVANRSLLI